MNQNTKAALAAGIAGGYVMGRTKKAKLAFAIATYIAGRRFGLRPRELAATGLKKVQQHPQLAHLGEKVRGDVLEAGRAAASSAAQRRIENVADAIHARTEALRAPRSPEAEEEAEPPEHDQGKG